MNVNSLFVSGVAVLGGATIPSSTGNYYFVDSVNGSDGNTGETSGQALATLDAGINKCTANNGDVIIIMPNHSETVSSATAINLDTAGITVIGLGTGLQRPLFTLDTANTATLPVSAADVAIHNCDFSANFADIAALFTLTTAKNFQLYNCKFKATAANMNFVAIIETNTTDNAADGLVIKNSSWIEPDTATTSMVNVDADLDSMVLEGNYLNLGVNTSDLPALVEVATGKDVTNIRILDNEVVRLNDANPLLLTADTAAECTGICKGNKVNHADTAGEALITTTTRIGHFENYATAVVDKSGFILPAIDS